MGVNVLVSITSMQRNHPAYRWAVIASVHSFTPCQHIIKLSHAFYYGIQGGVFLSRMELTNPCYLVTKLRFVVSVD